MKIKNLSKDRSAKPKELFGMTFWVKPADQNIRTTFTSRAMRESTELISHDMKRHFAKTHITDWEGVIDEDGKAVEFTVDAAIAIFTDEDNDDAVYELFNFSYRLANEADANQQDDAEAAAKKSGTTSTKASNRKPTKSNSSDEDGGQSQK